MAPDLHSGRPWRRRFPHPSSRRSEDAGPSAVKALIVLAASSKPFGSLSSVLSPPRQTEEGAWRTSSSGQAGSSCGAQLSFLVSFSPQPSAPLATQPSLAVKRLLRNERPGASWGPEVGARPCQRVWLRGNPGEARLTQLGVRGGGALDGGPARAFPGGKVLARAGRVGGRRLSAWKKSFLI